MTGSVSAVAMPIGPNSWMRFAVGRRQRMKTAYEIMKKGGTWLSALRERVKSMYHNGDIVTWGSDAIMRPAATISDLETLGSVAVAAYYTAEVEPLIELLKYVKAVLIGQIQVARDDDKDVLVDMIAKLESRVSGLPLFVCQVKTKAQYCPKVPYPICPINLFFEGDEDKCDSSKCNWDVATRMCSEECRVQGDELSKIDVAEAELQRG
jgi:hypothetical protein